MLLYPFLKHQNKRWSQRSVEKGIEIKEIGNRNSDRHVTRSQVILNADRRNKRKKKVEGDSSMSVKQIKIDPIFGEVQATWVEVHPDEITEGET